MKFALPKDKTEAAAVVGIIFNLYHKQNRTCKQIESILKELNIKTRHGKDYNFSGIVKIAADTDCLALLPKKEQKEYDKFFNFETHQASVLNDLKDKIILAGGELE